MRANDLNSQHLFQVMISNGQSAENAQRIEEGCSREVAGQQVWVSEACAEYGGASREEPRKGSRQRIIYIENSYKMKTPFTLYAESTQDIERFLFQEYNFDREIIGLSFSSARFGTIHREVFNGTIPRSYEDVYVRLFLKKHPPLPAKIETNTLRNQ